ncbi:TniQ family protein [Acidovorax sp. LjRoot118]|uniref:TniQ family protein n=1 Tax=unclassified Acidovorax TaxID=2684926 RepID=UPI000A3ED9F9|nr:TniQ family protein [Acidovorax sp. Root217]
MSTLVQLSPFPEELDRGYLGRLMLANGCIDTCSAFNLIERHFQIERGSRTTHDLLSRAAQMDSRHFGLRHTTMPLTDGISMFRGAECFPETTLKPERSSKRRKVTTNFCEECMKADVKFHGISYWRREHQTPGHLWCEKHQSPLRFIYTAEPGLRTPSFYVDQGGKVSDGLVVEAQRNYGVQQYLLLVDALYEREKPLDGDSVHAAIFERAANLGMGIRRKDTARVFIDDRVRDQFPATWLNNVFGDLSNRDLGWWMNNGDRQVHSKLVLIAALFESCEQAYETIAQVECKLIKMDAGRVFATVGDERSRDALNAYRNASGIYSAVSRDSDGFPDARMLKKMGLPDLEMDGVAVHLVKKGLERFFLEQGSIADSAEVSGLSVQAMEQLIRNCAPNMWGVLRAMNEGFVQPQFRADILRKRAATSRSLRVSAKGFVGARK